MAEQEKYTVAERVKIRGTWRDPGDKVLLTDEERRMYAPALEGEDGPYSTTQVPPPGYDSESYQTRPMTPRSGDRPLKVAQEKAGAPEATRPDRTEPQEPSLADEQEEADAQKAATVQDSAPQEGESEPLAEQEPVEPEKPSSKGSLAEQTAEGDLADKVPYYSYLEKDGTYTTREEIAAATDEQLEAVNGLSSARIGDIREVIPHSGS